MAPLSRIMKTSFWTATALMMVLALVVAACGGEEEEPTPRTAPAATATPRPAPTTTPTLKIPKRGGILRTRLQAAPDIWNLLERATRGFPVVMPVLSSLIQFDMAEGKITGDLADSWTVSADGKQITFKLRSGVKWHDGVLLKASDVKYNLDTVFLGARGFRSHLQGLFAKAESVETPDNSTVRITLKQPSNAFLRNMTHSLMLNYAPHVPLDVLNDTGNLVGTNAFKQTRWTKDVKIEQRANADFFGIGADGKRLPYLEGVDFFIIPDSAAHLAAFRTRNIDFFDHTDSSALKGQSDSLKRDIPGLIVGGDYNEARVLFLKNKPPFDDIRVRKALQLGIDRKEFVDVALEGFGLPAGLAMTPAGDGGVQWGRTFDEQKTLAGLNTATRARDVADAVRLLKEAGFDKAKPLPLTLYTFALGAFADEATVAVRLLNRLEGVNVTLKAEERGDFVRRLAVPGGNFEIIYLPFAQAFDEPAQTIGTLWTSTAPRNYGEWKDTQVDQWYDQQETTTSETERRKLIRQILERLYDQAYNIVIAWPFGLEVQPPDVKGSFFGAAFANKTRFDKTWIDR